MPAESSSEFIDYTRYLEVRVRELEVEVSNFKTMASILGFLGFYKEKTKVTSYGALLSLIFGGGVSLIWFFLNNPYNISLNTILNFRGIS